MVHRQWRELATRLIADAQLLANELHASDDPPSPGEATELVRATGHVVAQLAVLNIRIGRAYGSRLPEDVLDQYRAAVGHLSTVSIERVADGLGRAP